VRALRGDVQAVRVRVSVEEDVGLQLAFLRLRLEELPEGCWADAGRDGETLECGEVPDPDSLVGLCVGHRAKYGGL
jgi:hypothetical protein